MPVRDASAPRRFSLTLDPALVLERAILQQLTGLPPKRAKDWLRSLLAQGFLAQGRWLRTETTASVAGNTPPTGTIPATPFSRWLNGSRLRQPSAPESSPTAVRPSAATTQPATAPSHASLAAKPFAHLRRVIG